MKTSFFIINAIIGICFMTQKVSAEDSQQKHLTKIEALEKRIATLEKLVQSLVSKTNNDTNKIEEFSEQAEITHYAYEDLSEEINNRIKISGYADVEYKGSSKSGVNEEFRMHHLSLFFSKQFDNNIKFFSEIEYEDAPKFEGENDGSGDLDSSSGKIFVEAVNFDWNHSQYINLRAGRFFTPAGIWSEDHYPPFVTTQERPLHIRNIFPQLVDGLSFFGSTEFTPNHFFNYTTFIGNGESNVSGKKDLNSSKALGFKGDYHAPWLDDFTLGFTLYSDNKDTSNDNADKEAYGYHLKLRHENLTLQAEYAKAKLGLFTLQDTYKRKGYYGQILYNLKQWDIGYRYDFYNKTTHDIDEVTRNSLFINYHVNENFSLKGEYHDDNHNDPLQEDFNFYIFSITGYLGK